MKIINSGEFKHPIRIERFFNGVDEDNIPTKEWKDIIPNKIFKAKIKNTSGYEKIIANGDASIDKKRFYIRYKKDLNLKSKDRIVYNKQNYNITYVSDIEELHKYYEIVAELVQ
ncbi:phage head closure protein [Clostridium botulinum]|uniref:phage head closure protein n=1 Tax=Clostridium botulinum TaxID=1491 RepID=UPI001C9B55B2|nr:phage head closure protein [Clostridium botulinum]MBY6809032.1 phage head closure protein [Clostridium botulinum]MBY6822263.1 phage head closure protein [Clostridium botulinum]MBY6832947.1 phage head closure protein [Clostridium botulinum]MBY6972175.1 phage head closure protein [Clostridium botulinum]HBJ1649410.1 phage head closure protein [Clostridium botulinum]